VGSIPASNHGGRARILYLWWYASPGAAADQPGVQDWYIPWVCSCVQNILRTASYQDCWPGYSQGLSPRPLLLSKVPKFADSLPWSSLFHRPTCPPWPLAPLESPRQQQPLASGPFLLFVLLLVWLAGPVGSVKGKSGSQMQVSSSRMCNLRVASLVQCPLIRKQQRGRQKGRGNGARLKWTLAMSTGRGNVFERHVAASAA
jgi:hypothetical protein